MSSIKKKFKVEITLGVVLWFLILCDVCKKKQNQNFELNSIPVQN